MPVDIFSKELYKHKVYGNEGNPEVLNEIPDEAKTILDVGCGAGDNARILKRLDKYVTGITISRDEAVLVKEICDEVIIANIENDELFFDRKFDTIILSHICEHLVHPAIAINKLSNYLNKNGILVIAIPNTAFYKYRFKLFRGDWTMHETGPFDNTHLHFYSYDSADKVCDEQQVCIIKKIPGQLAIPLWPFRKLIPAFSKKMDKAIGKYFPNLFAQQVILVLEIRNEAQLLR